MRDAYQEITDRIIAALERGTVPWRTPWRARGHRNARSQRPYRGVNTLVLQTAALERGWSDPRWLTYRQARAAGGHVRRGEHGTRVVLWKWIEKADPEEPEGVKRFPLMRLYSVFNVAQCEDVRLPRPQAEECCDPLDRAEAVVAGYREGPAIHHDSESAYYVPERDEVHLPPRGSFTDAHGYYATLFHELAHSTGHPSRLAREGYRTAARFGSERYSQEELVAEFGAAFLGGEAGIDPSRVEQSAAYIASWLRVLDDDRRLVVVAAGQGQRASDHILGRSRHAAQDEEQQAAA
ncbi:MAG: zincin-like metallopeptidase domain-containing protein [bacterium]|nr:zincin-like metallopeptidase domain-containing protein [bacterium]